MSAQRRRGQSITVYASVETTDLRGDTVVRADLDTPYVVRGWLVPDRSSRAEVPGQQEINVYKIGLDFPIKTLGGDPVPNVDLWSRIDWAGEQWDVVSPPEHHFGSARTRHQSIKIRQRTAMED